MDDWATYSACAAVAVASLVVAYTENKKRKYPPGPSALPFIGSEHNFHFNCNTRLIIDITRLASHAEG